jgi:hypothetical protein
MGLAYGAGNLGKFIGPAGLALIAGSSNLVQWHAALGYFAEAPRLAEQTEARWFQAETVRLNGDLLVAMGDRTGVEASYREAIAITQQQSAKLWELRTAARPASPGCGATVASARRRMRCWRRSTTGSPRAATGRFCKRPRCCSMSWLELVDYGTGGCALESQVRIGSPLE